MRRSGESSVYGGGKWSFRVGENGDVKIFGTTEINQPSGTALRIKKDGLDKVKIEVRGSVKPYYDDKQQWYGQEYR